ncbi:uncharacterized protein FOMMEDRAFT_148016, partial [Fomitiporia mediterranea MF3/22]|uniref:uncharacterized protein n=1 Tax=Fomitiporia mediterranea (strain MF3/22) TaxID=694068 RepID=UPI0004409C37
MAPGNNFNNNNNNALQPRVPFVITPEQFVENQRWIQRQVELLSDFNRRGVETYLRAQQSLQRRIAEGDIARQQLEDLQRISNMRPITERPNIFANDVSQYAGPSHLANQRQPVLSPTNLVNPTNVSMNSQAAYTTNGISANNYTIGAQMPLSPDRDYNNVFQQGSSRVTNGEIYLKEPYPDVTQHQQQNTQTEYVRSRQTPSSIDPIQQVAERQTANEQSRFRTSYAPSNVGGRRASGQSSIPQSGIPQSGIPQAIFQRIYARERSIPESMRMSGEGSGRGHHVPAASTSSSLAGALGDYANAHLRGNASGYQLNMDQPLHLDSQTRLSEPRETQRTLPNQVQVPAGEDHARRDSRLHEPVFNATLAQQQPLDASGYQPSRDQSLQFDPRTRDAREAGATQRTLPSQVQVQAGEDHARRDIRLLETVLNTTLTQQQPIGTGGYQPNSDRSLQFDSRTRNAREAGATQRSLPSQTQGQAGEGHVRRDDHHHEPTFSSTVSQRQPLPTVKDFLDLPPMSPEELLQRQNELDNIIKLQDRVQTYPIKDTVSIVHGDDRAYLRTEGPTQLIAENQNADSRSATSEYQGLSNVHSVRSPQATGAEPVSQQHVNSTAPPPSGTSSNNSVPPFFNANPAALASTVNPALLQQKIPVSPGPHTSDTSKFFPPPEIKMPVPPYTSATSHSDTSVHPPPATQTMQSPSVSNGQKEIRMTTPPPHDNRPPIPITPDSANKKTLAKDILWAFGIIPAKRSASEPSSTSSEDELQPPLKRQAVEPVTVMMQDLTDDPPVMTFETNPGSARIEEVPDSEAEDDDNPGSAVSNPLADYTTIDDHVELVPVSNSDTTGASDANPHTDQPPPVSAVESHASSEDVMLVDTVLQHPPEDSSNPLFLPSPDSPQSSSSPPLAVRRTRRETSGPSSSPTSSRKPAKYPTQRSQVFVEVPKLTEEQRLLFFKRRTNPSVVQQRASRRETKSTVDVTAPVDEVTLKLAQQASEISSSRLRERPCLWIDCSHVANSAKTLIAHVQDHVTSIPEKEKIFPCWWDDCIRRFNKRDALAQHLQNHVKKSIYCPYQGCENQFAHQLELLAHIKGRHVSESSELRPTTQPFRPSPRSKLPPLRSMLAYQAVDTPVQMARMSKERRYRLGPWVLKNCFGSVSLGGLKLNARNQPQGRRPGDVEQKVLGDWHDRYDFVEPEGATYPSNLADLESSKATQEIEAGLLLAPDLAGPSGPLEEQLLTSRADRIKHDDTYIIKSERHSEESEEPAAEIKEEEPDIEIDELRSSASPVMLVPGTPSQDTSSVYQDFLGVGEPQADEPSSL